MVRWQIGVGLLAAGIVVAAGASGRARGPLHVRPEFSAIVQPASWDACSAPPDRMAPMMTGMLGKPVTLASAPIDVLTVELKLDDGQKKRINAIQDRLEKEFKGLSKSGRGADPSAMDSKMTDILAQADKDIDGELNAEQRPLATVMLKKLSLIRSATLPPELYLELKLTDDQLKSLEDGLPDIKQENKERAKAMMSAGLARDPRKMQALMSALGEKVSSILNKDQKSLVEKYRKKHPQMMMPMMDFGSPF
jgi:hypothetical protein